MSAVREHAAFCCDVGFLEKHHKNGLLIFIPELCCERCLKLMKYTKDVLIVLQQEVFDDICNTRIE